MDTAYNYGMSQSIIAEYGWKNKIITKVTNEDEILKCFEELKVDKIYAILVRDTSNINLINKLYELKNKGMIEKVGASIYYTKELTQKVNVFEIPCWYTWEQEIPVMLLHSDVYIRSYWNLFDKYRYEYYDYIKKLKGFERKDLNHKLDFVVGVENLKQLKQNLELFK